MKLTKHFKLSEFKCRDGTPVPEQYIPLAQELAKTLQILRSVYGAPITILSGYRSPAHNKKVGGAPRSQHLKCAADIVVKGVSPLRVYSLLNTLMNDGVIKQGGLGIYKTFVHLDHRGRKARWDER